MSHFNTVRERVLVFLLNYNRSGIPEHAMSARQCDNLLTDDSLGSPGHLNSFEKFNYPNLSVKLSPTLTTWSQSTKNVQSLQCEHG